MTAPLPAVIIAGGRARRMDGRIKALLPLGDARVIDHLRARLVPQVGALAVNTNDPQADWAGLGLELLPDPVPGRPGPAAGVLAAMAWARRIGADRVVTVAGDTPFLPPDFVARLAAAPAPAAIAETDDGPDGARLHPVCGLWSVSLAPVLEQALARGERRMRILCDLAGARPVRFETTAPPPFFNINTAQDLARAARWIAEGR